MNTANGSCLLKLVREYSRDDEDPLKSINFQGGTVVMVGVTFELTRTSQDKPDEGRIEATVDGFVHCTKVVSFH